MIFLTISSNGKTVNARGRKGTTVKAAMGTIVVPIILSFLAIATIAAIMLWNMTSSAISFLGFDLTVANVDFVGPLVMLIIVMLGLFWGGMLFMFFGLIPFFRRTAKVYDLTEKGVRVTFRGNKSVNLDFADIEAILFRDLLSKSKRRIHHRILDPFGRIQNYQGITIWHLLKNWRLRTPGYSFGFSSRSGEIQVVRKKGLAPLQLILPFLYNVRLSRVFVLSPSDPKEFYEQLETAYAKWRRQ